MTEQAEHHNDEWSVDNLPNRLTTLRMILIPVVLFPLWAIANKWPWALEHQRSLSYFSAWLFGLASITDFVDGYIARKRKLVTVFGSFLDPIADKFLVVTGLIILQDLGRVPSLVVIVLVLREMYMTSLRLLALEKGIDIPVSWPAKWKTTFQMIAVPLLMAYDVPWPFLNMPLLGQICIYLASFLSIYSATEYTMGLIKKFAILRLKKRREKRNLKKQLQNKMK